MALGVRFAGALIADDLQPPDRSAANDTADIAPADVFVLVKQAQAELELLRLELGKPRVSQSLASASGATPREVYYEVVSLLEKADALTVDFECESPLPAITPPRQIRPADVARIVRATLTRLRAVKNSLGITDEIAHVERIADKQPSDVLTAVLQACRQLNAVLGQPVRPKDVYRKVSLAVRYASEIRTASGIATTSKAPRFERHKQPVDVYLRLLECFEATRRIAAVHDIHMMKIELERASLDGVRPSDVYDLASLVVAELRHLNDTIGSRVSLREHRYPGRFFPAHVYQKAGVLHGQLKQLETADTSEPRASNSGGEK